MANLLAVSWLQEGPFALKRWAALFEDLPLFIESFFYTIGLSIGALIIAFILGIIIGISSSANNRFLRVITRIYIEFFQNIPLLIQVFFVYYGLPLVGIVLDTYTTGIICVGLYHAAYIAEVIRSGIGSVDQGQFEAGQSQGFSYWETMWYIVLPQAVRSMLPPMTNQVVNLIKNTSTVAIISGADIMFTANSWSAFNLHYVPAFTTAAFLYFILCFPLTKLAIYLEKRNKEAFSR
ncbi:amino acid ABC transporter permease [Fundicoccus culcitae]|uniref:Amino acid ABC transporter permease n=1 Tax=Fundicoccus culcitae TaxID=2969821 RepID=A0ABY5P2V6_9LACT|nr:amino acid ABC transporter permease [Fundicoccus culcitae]UUX33062.1 amino acid ABC transporter permease [Fundicoccus culcitae]